MPLPKRSTGLWRRSLRGTPARSRRRPRTFFLQPCNPMTESLLQSSVSGRRIWIAQHWFQETAFPPELAEGQLREFHSTAKVFSAPFVVDGQLFAGVSAILRIRNHLLPDLCSALVFAAALGHHG